MQKKPVSNTYIDGDILLYQVGFATQHKQWACKGGPSGPPLLPTVEKDVMKTYVERHPDAEIETKVIAETPLAAILTIKTAIASIHAEAGGEDKVLVISGDTNYRTKVATIQPYKGNRVSEKPINYEALREWSMARPYAVVSVDEEADDILSRAMLEGHIAATIDKDLDNTPGWHYNFRKKEKYYVTPEQAWRSFYTQAITGDTADNIPGIKGMGPVKAKTALSDCHTPAEYESVLLDLYREVYDDPRSALTEVLTLLWMRRKDNEMFRLGGME